MSISLASIISRMTSVTFPVLPVEPSSVVMVRLLTERLPSSGAYIFIAVLAPRTISMRHPRFLRTSESPKSGALP